MHIFTKNEFRHIQANFERHDRAYKDILKLIPNFCAVLKKLCKDISVNEGSILKRLVGLVSYSNRVPINIYIYSDGKLIQSITYIRHVQSEGGNN